MILSHKYLSATYLLLEIYSRAFFSAKGILLREKSYLNQQSFNLRYMHLPYKIGKTIRPCMKSPSMTVPKYRPRPLKVSSTLFIRMICSATKKATPTGAKLMMIWVILWKRSHCAMQIQSNFDVLHWWLLTIIILVKATKKSKTGFASSFKAPIAIPISNVKTHMKYWKVIPKMFIRK